MSSHEVWEDNDGNTSSGLDYYDTAYNNTRQLDYYESQNVTTSSYAGAIKKNGNSNTNWWLRSAYSRNPYYFNRVSDTGSRNDVYANSTCGVSPAFRLG